MRKKIIIGNWKMYKTNSSAIDFVKLVDDKIKNDKNIIAGIAAPSIMLSDLQKVAKNISIVAQNCFFEKEGAYTGEISPLMLKDLNIKYAIIGHSERREIFNENDDVINKKVIALLNENISPILCCGESLKTYEQGNTIEWVKSQIEKDFKNVSPEDAKKIIIAYEPIWAIGTGKVATPQIAQNVCKEIRKIIENLYNKDVAQEILIQYGGSVKPENIKEILMQEDIDGALVGGASLSQESYLELLNF